MSAAQFGNPRGFPDGLGLGHHHPPAAPGVPGGEGVSGSAEVGGEEFGEEAATAAEGGGPEKSEAPQTDGRNVKTVRGGLINVH